eukprot:3861505-Rhodomonas_salina.1
MRVAGWRLLSLSRALKGRPGTPVTLETACGKIVTLKRQLVIPPPPPTPPSARLSESRLSRLPPRFSFLLLASPPPFPLRLPSPESSRFLPSELLICLASTTPRCSLATYYTAKSKRENTKYKCNVYQACVFACLISGCRIRCSSG